MPKSRGEKGEREGEKRGREGGETILDYLEPTHA